MGNNKSPRYDSDDDDDDRNTKVVVQVGDKKKKKKKEPKKPTVVKAVHASAASTDNDGVNVVGRVGIVFGTLSLLLFLMALVSPEWTIAKDVGSGSLNVNRDYTLSQITEAKFGMWRYCLSAKVEYMNNATRSICFLGYGDTYSLHGYHNGTEVVSEDVDACRHFEDVQVCERRYFIQWATIILIVMMIIADIYSEKLIINAAGCLLGALAGAASIAIWMNVFSDLQDKTDGSVEHGVGFMFMAGGFVSALFGTIFCAIDLGCLTTERFGCFNDGTQIIGRVGMLMGVLVWVLYVASLYMSNWAVTDNLGSPQHFEEFGLQGVGAAEFGLFAYCMELAVDAFGGEFMSVCLDPGEQVQFITQANQAVNGAIPSHSGCEIFEKVRYCERAKFVIVTLIISITIAFFSDIFSEKLSVNSMVMGLTFAGGVASVVQWLIFIFHISGPKNYGAASEVKAGGAFYAVLIGAGMALISAILNYLDFIDRCQCDFERNDYQEGKDRSQNGDCDCFLCFGDGTSGYDGVRSKQLANEGKAESRV